MRFVAALLAMGALASAGGVLAQTAPAVERYVVTGCVSAPAAAAAVADAAAGPSRFVITDTRAETPVVYRLDGDASKLKLHVGHTLEVSGPVSPGSSTARDQGARAPVLKVEKIVWIATNCRDRK